MARVPLPVDELLPGIVGTLRDHPALVLEAPTGAGKTTRVPPALLDAGLGDVVMLEPRRLAARAAAARIARERGVELGGEVGYAVRFDRKTSKATRLTVVTEGILLRRLQDDPFLEGVGTLVFDEFHERHLDGDLALALARRIQEEARPDLRLLVMSATLDVEPVVRFLGDAPRLRSEGKAYPVDVRYVPAQGREPLEDHVSRAVQTAAADTDGDLLVFLPGVGEIRRAAKRLEGPARSLGLRLMELYGDLSPARQDEVLAPGGPRKLVLATNIAESSVTLPGVTAVVDSGLARILRYDSSVGLDRLELRRISRASAEQRRGRAGRTAPGTCLRLWSEMEQRALEPVDVPEVLRVDLAGALLELLSFGESDPAAFPWFEAPRPDALARSLSVLEALGAVSGGSLTDLGRALSAFPAPPRVGRLLVEGARRGVPERAAWAAALLAERDPFRRGRHDPLPAPSDSDVLSRVRQLEHGDGDGPAGGLPRGVARQLERAQKQFLRTLDSGRVRDAIGRVTRARDADEALLRAIFAAFPDRLAKRRERGSDRARLVGGRGVRLSSSSAVTEPPLFVCVDVDGGGTEAWVRQASVVEEAWLDGDHLRESVELSFDPGSERVVARKVRAFLDLPLETKDHPLTDRAAAEALLVEVASAQLERVLPKDDRDFEDFLLRLRCLAAWRPELELPPTADDELVRLLPGLAPGCRSFADLRKAPWLDVLRGSLTHAQATALDREAPARLSVPSGSHIRLQYELGRPPVLAARIQELFGLERTPTLAGGRVPVLIHLLAPNGRPQQVTDDLESFWTNTYQVVRKELRRRYPKHSWPEDPRTARAERRPGRRR